MRIVGGRFKGRALKGPDDASIRPTSDRLRESLFNLLAHGYGDACADARVLDLFAGTGALALEALSRGAAFAVLVDEGTQARGLIRTNVEALGVAGITRIFRRDATKLGAAAPNQPFNLVFCDPPYGQGLGEKALISAAAGGWLKPGALIILEEAAGTPVTLPDGFNEEERREYGAAQVVIGRFGSIQD